MDLPGTPPKPAPLSEGNRLQRRYARWAAPHYARMQPGMRAEVEAIDRWLYGRAGLGVWLGLGSAVLATTAGLRASQLPLWLAGVCSLIFWGCVAAAAVGAWLRPERYTGQRLWRGAAVSLLLAYLGLVVGFLAVRLQRPGGLALETLGKALRDATLAATPLLLGLLVLMLALSWGVAQVRRQRSEKEGAARQIAEAQLRLLQAQIQPHFIFNTLAAVQHWVDTADPRAGPLLRALTSFLRGSTELLAREQTSVADEAALAGHYLSILQARLGDRLRFTLDIAPAVAQQQLPPGLLLSLVENAVEHGVAPAVAGGLVQVRGTALADGFELCVLDSGAGLAAGWQEGTGLGNGRQRLAHQFGERAALTVQPQAAGLGTRACIRVQTRTSTHAEGSSR